LWLADITCAGIYKGGKVKRFGNYRLFVSELQLAMRRQPSPLAILGIQRDEHSLQVMAFLLIPFVAFLLGR